MSRAALEESRPAPGERFRGRRVTVMGLGAFGGGLEVTRWLVGLGARVTVTDLRKPELLGEGLAALAGAPVELVLGEHRERDFTEAELVVVNPAVAPANPFVAAARRAGVALTSEIQLFLEATPARVVLVTGTQGKSSTCNAAASLLEHAGVRAHLGGNIGRSLLPALGDMRPGDVAVVEISSYQLEALPARVGFADKVAAVCVTNVLADHLERHGSIEAYEAAKRRILELVAPGATAVLSGEDPRVARWSAPAGVREVRVHATQAREHALHLRDGAFRLGAEMLGRVRDLRLPGAYQRENVLAALGLARALGAEPERLQAAVGRLTGLEHREQDLGRFGGRRVWDNGVSTTPDSTVAVLRSLDRPLVLVCGGQQKRLPLDELVAEARRRDVRVVAFGASGAELARAFEAGGVAARAEPTVAAAARAAFEVARAGDEVLFSPACASFDAYRNFRDRALAFRAALPPREGD
jgi:UDP-N-acetylmuramoylalanine--D-glutamate ligase